MEEVVNILKRAKKRERILSLPRFVGRKRIPQIPQHYPRKARRESWTGSLQDDREEGNLGQEGILSGTNPEISARNSSGNDQ